MSILLASRPRPEGKRQRVRGTRASRVVRRNPSVRGALATARRTFKRWHLFEPAELTRIAARSIPRVLVKLGELPTIFYRSNKWEGRQVDYRHATKRPFPWLCTGPDGRGLYIIGGRTRVTARGLVD